MQICDIFVSFEKKINQSNLHPSDDGFFSTLLHTRPSIHKCIRPCWVEKKVFTIHRLITLIILAARLVKKPLLGIFSKKNPPPNPSFSPNKPPPKRIIPSFQSTPCPPSPSSMPRPSLSPLTRNPFFTINSQKRADRSRYSLPQQDFFAQPGGEGGVFNQNPFTFFAFIYISRKNSAAQPKKKNFTPSRGAKTHRSSHSSKSEKNRKRGLP